MWFKLWNYKKVFFFDFDDNIISLLDSNIYYYEIVNWSIKVKQVNTRNFASFFTKGVTNWNLILLDTEQELKEKVNDQKYNSKSFLVTELSYKDFREDNLFLKQVRKTCELDPEGFLNRLNLSFPSFFESCFNEKNKIFIVTARWQNNEVIYSGIKEILYRFIEIIIKEYNWRYTFVNNKVFDVNDLITYLNELWYYKWTNKIGLLSNLWLIIDKFIKVENIIPATNSKVLEKFWINQSAKPEKGKIIKSILNEILSKNPEKNWLIWFSDDMAENIDKVEKDVKNFLWKQAKEYNKNISLYLFYMNKKEEHIDVYHY